MGSIFYTMKILKSLRAFSETAKLISKKPKVVKGTHYAVKLNRKRVPDKLILSEKLTVTEPNVHIPYLELACAQKLPTARYVMLDVRPDTTFGSIRIFNKSLTQFCIDHPKRVPEFLRVLKLEDTPEVKLKKTKTEEQAVTQIQLC